LIAIACTAFSSRLPAQDKKTVDESLEKGRRLLYTGQFASAIAQLESIEATAPNDSTVTSLLRSAYRFMGIEYYVQSRCEDAILVWEKAMRLDPDDQVISSYIDRCRSELQGAATIQGREEKKIELPPVVAAPPKPKTEDKPEFPAPRTIITQLPPCTTYIATPIPRRIFGAGIAGGVSVRTAQNSLHSDIGWALNGHIAYAPRRIGAGLQLQCLYTRLYHDSTAVDDPSLPEFVSVFGANLDVTFGIRLNDASTLSLHAGPGIYEIYRSSMMTNNIIHRSTNAGVIIGAGWHRKIGVGKTTIDFQYLHLSGSLSPDMLMISFGLAV